MNFPLTIAFAASHRFWTIVLLFPFASRHFRISTLSSSVMYWLCIRILFSHYMFVFFIVLFSCSLFLFSQPCDKKKKKMLDVILIFLNILGLSCGPAYGQSWRMFHVHLRRMCILLFLDGMLYNYQLCPTSPELLSKFIT